jgi:spermidine synthase
MVKAGIFILWAIVLLLPFSGHAGMSAMRTLLEKDSRYQHLAVVEDTEKKERYLLTDKSGLKRGGIFLDAPDSLLMEYTGMSFVGLAYLRRDPSDVLFMGLGTGTMPRYLNRHYPGTRIDISEIDPDVLSVAQRYFFFRENQDMRVHIADGRAFLSKTAKKYDVIFLDAYQSGSLPFHLTTIEFLGELRKRLKSDGVLVANIQTSVITQAFHSILRTYRGAFPHVEIYMGRNSPNTVFVAGLGSVPLDQTTLVQRAREIRSLRKMDIDLSLYGSYRMYFSDPASETGVLADVFSPANGGASLKSGAR